MTEGQALMAVQGNFDGKSGRLNINQAFDNALARTGNKVKAQYFFSANGQSIGSFGQLTGEGSAFEANFDVNYTAVSDNYPASVPSQLIVQSGDTLRTIAARIFGDASLWYVIAEENGLSDPDAALEAGTQLRIPNSVLNLSNDASSFKPFDVSDAIGDTTPTQPFPKPKKGCGVLGQILVTIVAIVVTVIIQDYSGTTFGAILGAAAGSAASQGVAIALGMQEEFNWKQVGAAALAAGLVPGGTAAGSFGGTVGTAVVNSAINQGVNIALGLQDSFNWAAVAAAAVAAPLAHRVGAKVGAVIGQSEAGQVAARLATGFVNQVAYAGFNGGKINYVQLAVDAFGNALGNSIVDGMAPKPKTQSDVIGLTDEQRADMSAELNIAHQASQNQFNRELGMDVRQELFQQSLESSLSRTLSGGSDLFADMPAPALALDNASRGGNPLWQADPRRPPGLSRCLPMPGSLPLTSCTSMIF